MRELVLQLIGCETLENCQKVQAGNVYLRRLGKYSVLFTIAITVFVNDLIGKMIDNVTGQYDTAKDVYNDEVQKINLMIESVNVKTSSVLYRWTLGWFFSQPSIPQAPSMPELDSGIITAYNVLNLIQFAVFILMVGWCLRWIYADCQVTGSSFSRLLKTAAVSNGILYVALRIFLLPILT